MEKSFKSNFRKKSRLDMHEKTTTFRCEICGKSFINKTRLAVHIGAVHEGKKPFKCDICDYSSSQKGHMKTHVESVHEGRKKGIQM